MTVNNNPALLVRHTEADGNLVNGKAPGRDSLTNPSPTAKSSKAMEMAVAAATTVGKAAYYTPRTITAIGTLALLIVSKIPRTVYLVLAGLVRAFGAGFGDVNKMIGGGPYLFTFIFGMIWGAISVATVGRVIHEAHKANNKLDSPGFQIRHVLAVMEHGVFGVFENDPERRKARADAEVS